MRTCSPARSCGASTRSTAATIVRRLGQPARADVAARQTAGRGLDDVDAPAPQRGQVVLRRRVLPHLGVHGRADHDGRTGGEEGGGEEVVGDARGVATR